MLPPGASFAAKTSMLSKLELKTMSPLVLLFRLTIGMLLPALVRLMPLRRPEVRWSGQSRKVILPLPEIRPAGLTTPAREGDPAAGDVVIERDIVPHRENAGGTATVAGISTAPSVWIAPPTLEFPIPSVGAVMLASVAFEMPSPPGVVPAADVQRLDGTRAAQADIARHDERRVDVERLIRRERLHCRR
jgi:hypothetical protein